jgi:hypothetical protein
MDEKKPFPMTPRHSGAVAKLGVGPKIFWMELCLGDLVRWLLVKLFQLKYPNHRKSYQLAIDVDTRQLLLMQTKRKLRFGPEYL